MPITPITVRGWIEMPSQRLVIVEIPPADLPAERFEVVAPFGREGPYDLWEAHEIREMCRDRLGMAEDSVQVVPRPMPPS